MQIRQRVGGMRKESPRPLRLDRPGACCRLLYGSCCLRGPWGSYSATPQLYFAGGKKGLCVGSVLDWRDRPESCAAPPWLCKEHECYKVPELRGCPCSGVSQWGRGSCGCCSPWSPLGGSTGHGQDHHGHGAVRVVFGAFSSSCSRRRVLAWNQAVIMAVTYLSWCLHSVVCRA